ncbi:hypothetical protein [Sphingobium aquiterrae]
MRNPYPQSDRLVPRQVPKICRGLKLAGLLSLGLWAAIALVVAVSTRLF